MLRYLNNVYLLDRNGCFIAGGGLNFINKNENIFRFLLHVGN